MRIKDLNYVNLLATLELLADLQQELNLAPGDEPVGIRVWNHVIKYPELAPASTPGIRDI